METSFSRCFEFSQLPCFKFIQQKVEKLKNVLKKKVEKTQKCPEKSWETQKCPKKKVEKTQKCP